jgi:branched-subunit amino acid transport protein
MRDISMAIDTHQLRFLDVKLVGNFHMVGCFYSLLSYVPVTKKAIVIDSLISEKITWEQLTWLCVAIHTNDTGRMDRRG